MIEHNIQPQKQLKILLIGDDCLDVYQYGTVERISPEAPVPVFKYQHKEERGGMARNVKINLEELGCQVTYMCGQTTVKTRLIDFRSKQHLLRIDNDNISTPLSYEDVCNLDGFDAIVVSDYDKGYVSYRLIGSLIDCGIPVFIDTKKVDLDRMQGAWVKINELEYSKIKSACSGLIVTKGGDGAEAKFHNVSVKSPKVEVVDVTGAGDTFLAAFAYQYLLTDDLACSLDFANRAAAVTVQHMGCYAPSLEEII